MYAIGKCGITALIALFAIAATTDALFGVPLADSYTAESPQTIPATIIPPSVEPTVVFAHKGEILSVGLKSGKVTVLAGNLPVIPNPQPNPQPNPAINLTGNAKKVYDSFNESVTIPSKRSEGAAAMINAIESTESQVGGLGLTGQAIVNAFAANCASSQVNTLLHGWAFGDLLQSLGIQTDEDFMRALTDVKTAMRAVK